MSVSKNKSYRKFQRSPQKSTDYKLSRNLQLDFDNYQLKQQSAQYCESSSNQQPAEHHSEQLSKKIPTTQYKLERKSSTKQSAQRSQKQNYQGNHQCIIPKSYLLAMSSLQEAVEMKEVEIERMKNILLEKQEHIWESQTRINQLLKQYQQLAMVCEMKSQQINILKTHLKQARVDQQNAIKQAAKAIQQRFKNIQFLPPSQHLHFHHQFVKSGDFNKRSRITEINRLQHARKLNYDTNQRDYDPLLSQTYTKEQGKFRQDHDQVLEHRNKRAKSTYNKASSSHQQLLSQKSSAILSNSHTNTNFISYQREVLRNQKQLIALNYRMQCLQRMLLESTNKKSIGGTQKKRVYSERQINTEQKHQQEQIKRKIRELRRQIEEKECLLMKLKRI